LRAVAGLIFLRHGSQKLLGVPPTGKVVAVHSLPWFAGVMERETGTLIMCKLCTRPAAFLASGTMAAAYRIAHAPPDHHPASNGCNAAILYCFVFLVFAAPGLGPDASGGLVRGPGSRSFSGLKNRPQTLTDTGAARAPAGLPRPQAAQCSACHPSGKE
jgi:putative oxidoreductase